MSLLQGEEVEWDLDTDDVQSRDSDELYESRPNRWRGAGTAWLKMTEQDRLEAAALDQMRNQDLSIHLYNAYALKHQEAVPTRETPSVWVWDSCLDLFVVILSLTADPGSGQSDWPGGGRRP